MNDRRRYVSRAVRSGTRACLTALLAALVVSTVFYEAKVTTFGCTSTTELSDLQRIRSDTKAFQARLIEQIFQGQCLPIKQGTIVDGSLDSADPAVLRVGRQVAPPGYMAPLDDFEEKPSDTKQ
jgi:hypothetical protein